jgi:sigma-B regulation protein RsbU (phosphoserine phosphatase)
MADASYTVLIVDDSRANREYLADILEEDGYRIVQAAEGEGCLAAAESERPVLILLDVVMPGIDGFETLRRLKTSPAGKRAAVIMLTSLDDQDSKLKAFDYGAVDYIVKSASKAEVRARVRVHVRLVIANEELVAAQAESLRQITDAQHSLLVDPKELPSARFSVYYRSLHEAGGDFYDVVPVSKSVFFYLMVDVAGHDVATSYVTPAVKVLLRQCATPAYSVPESIAYLNGVLSKTRLEENYLTAFALRINRKAGKAVFLAAGHPPALFIPKEGPLGFVTCENPCIGMLEESSYQARTVDVRAGDRFVLYTDGLVELSSAKQSSGKKTWIESYESLVPVALELRDLPLAELPAALVHAIGADSPEDDVAVMAVEV